ncbi:SNF1-related protein kinase regulatory subunit gamma-1 [Bienertia sinuspersici]
MEVQLRARMEKNDDGDEKERIAMECSSPEAKLGIRVEDLWDNQEPQLSPTDKLNVCFESIPVSSFPLASASQVEIRSDCSLAEAVRILSQHKILSVPVVDVEASDDATWMERYIGIVEFAGIAVWILHQSEDDESNRVIPSPESNSSVAAFTANDGNGNQASMSPRSAAMTSGNFFGALTASELYKKTTVRDISGTFRWAPFLALQDTNSMLTVLLLLSKYKMKSVPVVGKAKIENIITQSAVIHMLAECAGLHWFESFGTKKLTEIGLPLMSSTQVVKVYEDESVLQAFRLMRLKGIGGIPVVERHGAKAVGNISVRDIQFLLTAPEIYKDCRSITAKDFLLASKKCREEHEGSTPLVSGMITCRKDDTLKNVILTLDSLKIHRIYVVDESEGLEGVITLRDIISRLVHEPRNYFGDFFDGFIPNCRV